MATEINSFPLSVRLDRLFRSHGERGRSWTNDQVAEALRIQSPGIRVTGGYLSALRNGGKTNPSMDLQRALAEFFGVPVSFLSSPSLDSDSEWQAATKALMDTRGVRAIALRAIGVKEDSLATLAAVLDNIRALQGLPPVDEVYSPNIIDIEE